MKCGGLTWEKVNVESGKWKVADNYPRMAFRPWGKGLRAVAHFRQQLILEKKNHTGYEQLSTQNAELRGRAAY